MHWEFGVLPSGPPGGSCFVPSTEPETLEAFQWLCLLLCDPGQVTQPSELDKMSKLDDTVPGKPAARLVPQSWAHTFVNGAFIKAPQLSPASFLPESQGNLVCNQSAGSRVADSSALDLKCVWLTIKMTDLLPMYRHSEIIKTLVRDEGEKKNLRGRTRW